MDVIVIKKFKDKEDGLIRRTGSVTTYEVDRATELIRFGYVKAWEKPEKTDIMSLKKPKLLKLAMENGIEGYEDMKVDQLRNALIS